MPKETDAGEYRYALRLPRDIAEGMQKLAAEHRRSLQGEFEIALREYVNRHKKED